jgi:hypothetical protein
MWNIVLTVVGSILLLIGSGSYVWSIIKGDTRPHRVSWGGWALAGFLGVWASLDGGAKIGLLVTALVELIVVTVFVLSLFKIYGKPGGRKSDYIAGTVAAVALISWRAAHFSPSIAVTIAILADAVFVWFTVREAWLQPDTEPLQPWIIAGVGAVLGFLALGDYNYAAAAYPAYIIVAYLVIILTLVYQKTSLLKSLLRTKS